MTPRTGTGRRRAVLAEVEACVCRDRQQTHGEAEDNFADIASIASTVLADKLAKPLQALDVAIFMAIVKLARMRTSQTHKDNFVDLAGYAVCGAGILAAQEAAADG